MFKVVAEVDLTESEENFVLAICFGYPATRAAHEAGYSTSHAAKLLTLPHIRAALSKITGNVDAAIAKHERAQAKRQRRAA